MGCTSCGQTSSTASSSTGTNYSASMSNCCSNDCTCPDIKANGETCDELHELNTVKVGYMACTIQTIFICNLPKFMGDVLKNQYCVNKNLINQICALWKLYKDLEKRVNCLVDFIKDSNTFDRYVDTFARTSAYNDSAAFYRDWKSDYDVSIYMDSETGVDGTVDDGKRKTADQDYRVTITACMDGNNMGIEAAESNIQVITPYRSTETFTDNMETARGRHFESTMSEMAVPVTFMMRVKQGEYVKLRVRGKEGKGTFRLHQLHVVWAPISNAGALPDCLD